MRVGIFAGIPVQNYADALPWYTRLFDSEPTFCPHDTQAVWQLAENCRVYAIQDGRRAGGAVSMIGTDDPRSEAA